MTKAKTLLTFSQAIEALKIGHSVCRSGWNGKNMFIYLNKGSVATALDQDKPEYVEGIKRSLFEPGFAGTATRLPNLNMRAATGATVTGWLASQTDILAEDWMIVEPVADAPTLDPADVDTVHSK